MPTIVNRRVESGSSAASMGNICERSVISCVRREFDRCRVAANEILGIGERINKDGYEERV